MAGLLDEGQEYLRRSGRNLTGLLEWLGGGAAAGAEPIMGLMRGDAIDEPFLPTADSGGRIGAIASAITNHAIPGPMPAGSLGTFGGIKSATADKKMLKQAKTMEKAGASVGPSGDTRQATGWFKDKAGDWKYEIPDNGMRLKDPYEFLTPEQREDLLRNPNAGPAGARLGDAVEHPALFGAYPEMADYPLSLNRSLDPHSAWFSPMDKTVNMGITTDPWAPVDNRLRFSPPHRLTALHEMQHGVQHIEGFAQGGSPTMLARKKATIEDEMDSLRGKRQYAFWEGKSPDDPEVKAMSDRIADLADELSLYPVDDYKGYQHLLGEVEARDVEARADLDPAERRMSTPYASQGVPADKQIIRKGDAEFSFSEPPPPDTPSAPLSTDQPDIPNEIPPDVAAELAQASATMRPDLWAPNVDQIYQKSKDVMERYRNRPDELMADGYRYYKEDPAGFKAKYPNAAAYIRSQVNDDPLLSQHVQFNVTAPSGGLLAPFHDEQERR